MTASPFDSSSSKPVDELTGSSDDGYDSLFGGEPLISLFNKTHGVGDVRTGIISKAPEDVQSRMFKADGVGPLKFWGKDGKPTADANAPDGTPLKPCMQTMFVLDTEYSLAEAELAERGMDEDSGKRGVFASGQQLGAIRKAIRDAKVTNRAQLVGMRLSLVRTGKKTAGDFKAWTWDAKLETGGATADKASNPFG